ncbi:hypothetical protein N9B82_03090 [Saprospiraceae bacterium]|nr:hypothetical protein [Saprospiraceae bacterium]
MIESRIDAVVIAFSIFSTYFPIFSKTQFMRLLTIITFVLYSLSISAQISDKPLAGVKIADKKKFSMEGDIPVVVHLSAERKKIETRFILNGELVASQTLETLNPDFIESIRVEKDKNSIDNYNGTIFITTKNAYQPKLITVQELLNTYLNDLNRSDKKLVFLNNKVIHEDLKTYMVDERYILKIEVEKKLDTAQDIDLYIINLVPRTQDNVDKANTIILRGQESKG